MIRPLIILLLLLLSTTNLLADSNDTRHTAKGIGTIEPFEFDEKDSLARTRQRLTDWIKEQISEGHDPEALQRSLHRGWERYVDHRRRVESRFHKNRPAQRVRAMEQFQEEVESLRKHCAEHAKKLHAERLAELQKKETRRIQNAVEEMSRNFKSVLQDVVKRRQAIEEGDMRAHLANRLDQAGLDEETLEKRREQWRKERSKRRQQIESKAQQRRETIQKKLLKGEIEPSVEQESEGSQRALENLKNRGYSEEEIKEIQRFIR